MLGTLKPRHHDSVESQTIYQAAHCSTCKTLQKRSLTAPLSLSREATWLTLFGVALLNEELDRGVGRCSAMPLLKRTLLSAPEWLLELSGALSIIAGQAALDDHMKDGEHRLRCLILKPTITPHLSWALERLPIDQATLEAMSEPVGEVNVGVDDYLRAHHPSVGLVWSEALLRASKCTQKISTLTPLAHALCDLLLLHDAIQDLDQDLKSNAPNPLTSLHHAPHEMRRLGAQLLRERVRVARSQVFYLTAHISAQTSLWARDALLDALPTPHTYTQEPA